MTRTYAKWLVAPLALATGFGWGFLSHRHQLFPYDLLWRFAGSGEERYSLISGTAQADLSRLASLPYIDAQFDPNFEAVGVPQHDDSRAWPSLILQAPGVAPACLVGACPPATATT